MLSKAGRAPNPKTRFLYSLESPATLPKAQAHCSRTSSDLEDNNLMNIGTAPALTTARVRSEVPEAILVKAQAASN